MNSPIACDTPEAINAYHMLSLKGALKLETLGMKHSRGSAAKTVKQILKDAGKKPSANKTALLSEFVEFLKEKKILA